MKVTVLLFASIAEVVGSRQLKLNVENEATIDDLLDELESSYPQMRKYRSVLLTALNEEYVDSTERLADGDEVAVFPPVSGGQGEVKGSTIDLPHQFYQITCDQVDSQKIARELLNSADGAICVFEGVVRNNSEGKATSYLIYEGYSSMALKKFQEIGEFARKTWDIRSIAIVHRLGKVAIGETSVAVVVTAPHRRPAFDSCQYAIDQLKKTAPVWKKEFFEDGAVWVEGQG